ncbi:hypothetical protein K438DRAFT_866595 [Mycena galopus ATCC 62051]|nr:hypothetical protein K438DRAFT_866595 [Mycena galopus ATCC 62051]
MLNFASPAHRGLRPAGFARSLPPPGRNREQNSQRIFRHPETAVHPARAALAPKILHPTPARRPGVCPPVFPVSGRIQRHAIVAEISEWLGRPERPNVVAGSL